MGFGVRRSFAAFARRVQLRIRSAPDARPKSSIVRIVRKAAINRRTPKRGAECNGFRQSEKGRFSRLE
jgi:hypothetical protein